jgi:Uma2 family endonuclease
MVIQPRSYIEKMPAEEHGEVTVRFSRISVTWCVLTREARHRMPDVSFISGQRPTVKEGTLPCRPDLAVEVRSPDDSYKAYYYLASGARLVWVVDPVNWLVIAYAPDVDEQIILENEILTGGDVLPGFEPPVRAIFANPLQA